MKTNIAKLASLVFVILTGALGVNAQADAVKPVQLRVIKYHGDMANLLANLAESDGTPIGLETDTTKQFSVITIDLENVTIREILNGVVQSEPRYRWRETDGAIDVVPANQTVSLMDTPVNTFKVSDVSPTEAIDQLLKLPEVESAFQLRGLRRSSSPVASATRRNEARNSNTEKKISLDLSGVTVRQVLHRIAAESDTKFWIFRRHGGGTFSLGTSPINWP
jgi:hypothetical protein